MNTKYDDIIIGFGKGGKTIAGALEKSGRKVALIEKSAKMYGGTCINVGCIPTKSLVHSAGAAASGCIEKSIAYANAVARKTQLVEKLRLKNYKKLDTNPNITIIDGTARFISDHKVEVQRADGVLVLESDRFFINTGSSPFIPPIQGIQGNPYVYVSESLLDMETLPERLVIIGGGYIGVEFASIYADFGVDVTILQDGSVFLPREDTEIADMVRQNLDHRGARVLTEVQVQEIKQKEGFAEVVIKTKDDIEILTAEAILVATESGSCRCTCE